mmetsp:Transcript_41707/g.73258  ORF Transcript_41707/g.73258 Transcript_41707/m.73258 type:complete len:743 (+) Transcript_41707:44-2272(+)
MELPRDDPGTERKPILPIPKEVVASQEELSTEDIHHIAHFADLPGEENWERELLQWASNPDLEMAIKKPGDDSPNYEFIRKGNFYNKSAVPLLFYRKADSRIADDIDRAHLCHLAGCIRHLFEPPMDDCAALVGIEYGDELNPINGSITSQRHYEQVSFEEIIAGRLSNLSGKVENVRFTGVVKAVTMAGLRIPIQLGVFSRSSSDDANSEPLGDRATRMLHQCSESRNLTAARNLLSMLNKTKLIDEFKDSRSSFPRIKNVQELAKKIDGIKSVIRREIPKFDKLAALCSLLETAISTKMDEDLDAYCQRHFLLCGMNRNVVTQFVALAHHCMDEHGKSIFQCCRSSLQDVLPLKVAATILNCIDGMLPSKRFRYISSVGLGERRLGIELVEVNGSEVIELVKFKRTSIRPLLSNIGLVAVVDDREVEITTLSPDIYLSSIELSWSRYLTHEQKSLQSIASQMCFKTTTSPFPSPSISPDFAKGALVFVNPAITRDLPEMVAECERRGHRVGFGVMFCSKSMTDLVMKVLDPKRAIGENGDFLKTKSTAFTKVDSKVVLELPPNPSLSTRKLMLEETKKQTAPNFLSEPGVGASQLGLEVCSLDTRLTRTTGDLPNQMSEHRPNACDRPHRQPLRGHIRGDTFVDKREKAVLGTGSIADSRDGAQDESYSPAVGSSRDATWTTNNQWWSEDGSWWSGWWQPGYSTNHTSWTSRDDGWADTDETGNQRGWQKSHRGRKRESW